MFCFITGRHRPILESEDDERLFYILYNMGNVSFAMDMNTLKRSGMVKSGFPPLSMIVGEAGLHETLKRLKKMNTAGIERSETFKVVSPFECMFLNKPFPTGLFYDTIYVEEDNPSQQV